MAGEIIVSGSGENSAVTLNGERAYSGRTFFSSGVIATPETGSAVVNLGKLGRINVAPNSLLSLSFTPNSISGKLSSGQIKVFSSEGVSVNIETSDNVVTNDANQSGVFTVNVQSGATQAVAESGSITLKNGVPPTPQQTPTDDDDDNSILVPVLVFAGIVGAAAIYTFTRESEELQFIVSPNR
ncbi:MAG TPA: hypothetical protein VGB00_03075 [Pyrinomonadaceae bacterium]